LGHGASTNAENDLKKDTKIGAPGPQNGGAFLVQKWGPKVGPKLDFWYPKWGPLLVPKTGYQKWGPFHLEYMGPNLVPYFGNQNWNPFWGPRSSILGPLWVPILGPKLVPILGARKSVKFASKWCLKLIPNATRSLDLDHQLVLVLSGLRGLERRAHSEVQI